MTHPFDEFSKSLSDESVPRRESLRRLGAVVAGAVLGPLVLGVENVSAHPRDRELWRLPRFRRWPWGNVRLDACATFCKRCRTNAQRNQCLTACRACSNNPLRLNGSCGKYVCCGSGQAYCRGACVDLKTDPNNCGSCGKVCRNGKTCINGKCSSGGGGGGNECPSGQARCGDICVNPLTDNNNCGSCGNVCGAGKTCVNGICTGGANDCLTAGHTRCSDGFCHNLAFDSRHCGACGNVCPEGTSCRNGVCQENDNCPAGQTRCGDACVNLLFDHNNCGACGVVCDVARDIHCIQAVCTPVAVGGD